jgi:NADH-quinone oxidoreductase subunit B
LPALFRQITLVAIVLEKQFMPTQSEIGYDSKIEGDVVVTTVDAALNWFRKNSVWPMPMGLACCAIELMAVGASRFDISRFGSEVMRFSPRQADCMIVAGTVTYKMAGAVRASGIKCPSRNGASRWARAPRPAGCIAATPCCKAWINIIPVDIYVSGCPPRPEAVLDALMKLQTKSANSRSCRI